MNLHQLRERVREAAGLLYRTERGFALTDAGRAALAEEE